MGTWNIYAQKYGSDGTPYGRTTFECQPRGQPQPADIDIDP